MLFFMTSDGEENTVSLYLHQNDSIIDVKESTFVWQGKMMIMSFIVKVATLPVNLYFLQILFYFVPPCFPWSIRLSSSGAHFITIHSSLAGPAFMRRWASENTIYEVKVRAILYMFFWFLRQRSSIWQCKASYAVDDHISCTLWSHLYNHRPLYYPGSIFSGF